jgi:3-dehydroquinate synthase
MQEIQVRAPSGQYSVLYGRGALAQARPVLRTVGNRGWVFVLSSPKVWKHWGMVLEDGIGGLDSARHIIFDDREDAKNLRTVEKVCRQLVRAGADRNVLLFALGGGVVGDVAGLVAATYMRSVGLIHVPTTLMAQVDSSIGGKTGVNLPEGKNLVGAFYPPLAVITDPEVLSSLPKREYRSGIYEIIKYGVIGDVELFQFLEHNLDALLAREASALDWVVPRCIRAKAEIVEHDEREAGQREILNFGHTVGHALETATHYRRFLHGEAVAWGMMGATLLSHFDGGLPEADAARILRLIARVGPLPSLRNISAASVMQAMRTDKKSRDGEVRWILPRAVGQVVRDVKLWGSPVHTLLPLLPDALRAARGAK